jgi:hypothetical protein
MELEIEMHQHYRINTRKFRIRLDITLAYSRVDPGLPKALGFMILVGCSLKATKA